LPAAGAADRAAAGAGLLSLSQAPDHVRAARATSALRADLERAMDKAEELGSAGAGPQILVVRDTPADEVLHPFAGGIGHLLDASLTGRVPTGPLPRPMLVTTDAFTTFAREPEFDETRASGTLLVVEHELVVLPAPALFEAPPLWRGAASSPDLDLDPFTVGALVVVVPAERLAAGEPLPRGIDFSARATGAPARTIGGLWLASRGRTEGLFDFSDDLDWLLAGRIGRIWFEGGLARVDACELLPSLPGARGGAAEALAPEVVDSAWRFAIPPSAAELEVLGDPPVADGYRLTQLDLTSLRLRVFEASTGQPGILHFAGAERGLETWSQGEVAWTLERRVDGRTIWRHRGRRP